MALKFAKSIVKQYNADDLRNWTSCNNQLVFLYTFNAKFDLALYQYGTMEREADLNGDKDSKFLNAAGSFV